MGAGQLVFPIVMSVVILFVGGYVVTTPATPAPEDPQQRLVRVEPGDQLLLEVTGYYAAPDGRVFFSTQEERHAELPRGDVAPQLQQNPVSYTLGDEADPTEEGLDRALLGRRAGDRFTTPVIAPRNAFGDWEENKTLSRVVATLPVRVEFDRNTQVDTGRRFNATEYRDFFAQEGHDLTPGTVFPCEDGEDRNVWDCQLVEIDLAQDRVVYERIIEAGAAYSLQSVVEVNTVGDRDWNFTVRPTADGQGFDMLLDPPVGTMFQLRQDLRDPYKAGTYHVVGSTADSLQVRYSSASNVNPLLIGQPVQYDIVILRILRG